MTGGDTNKNGNELSPPPDFLANSIEEAAKFILYDYEILKRHALDLISSFSNCNRSKHVLITGLSRVGKSTFASVVRGELERLGLTSHVFSTDYFLEKSTKKHSRKFDSKRASSTLEELNGFNLNGLREYFHIHETNTDIPCSPLNVAHNDIVIVEGGIPTTLHLCNEFYHVSISTDDELRFNRFKES